MFLTNVRNYFDLCKTKGVVWSTQDDGRHACVHRIEGRYVMPLLGYHRLTFILLYKRNTGVYIGHTHKWIFIRS